MRKLIALLINFVCVLVFTSCDINAPLRNKMLDYYSNNQNYVTLVGEVIEIDESFVVIKCEELMDYINYETELSSYCIYSETLLELKVGEQIEFTTVPFHFYNGHILPIVELQVNGNALLSFEEGKDNLIDWVNSTFK